MAEQFNQLLAARYSRGVRSLLGLEEQEGVTAVAGEVVPFVELASLRDHENRFLNSEYECIGHADIDPAALDRAMIRLGNADGGPLIASQYIELWAPVAVEVTLRIQDTDLPSNGTKRFLDRRRRETGDDPAARFQTESGTEKATTIVARYSLLAGATELIKPRIVLPPVTTLGFMLQTESDDRRLVVNWYWRERPRRADEERV